MSENINDGGPAFPVHAGHVMFNDRVVAAHHPGMSLRDYFAGQALPVIILSALQGHAVRASDPSIPLGPEDFAKAAWENADMMLAARGKGVGK